MNTDSTLTPPFGGLVISVAIDKISADDQQFRIELGNDERSAIARALDVIELGSVILEVNLKMLANSRISAKGNISAEVVQSCVVTLEPVACEIDEVIDIQYWPESSDRPNSDSGSQGEIDIDPLGLDEPEYYSDNKINLGQLVFETLSSAIDPYPRNPGVSLDWNENHAGVEQDEIQTENPFAVLSNLKTNNMK